MPNIFHQSVEDILKAATPEQRLMWNSIFLRWGERVPIAQLFYIGSATGTEFLTYSANKLYVAYSFEISTANTFFATGVNLTCALYDPANAAFYSLLSPSTYWDATAAAARNVPTNQEVKNIYFSRLLLSGYSNIKFIGYRIAI